MKRNLIRNLALAALFAVAPLVVAQDPPGPPPGGGHFGRPRPPRPHGGPGLLLRPEVQQELNLSESQVNQLREALRPRGDHQPPGNQGRPGGRRPPRGGPGGGGPGGGGPGGPPPMGPSPEERERMEATIRGILDAAQYKRYREISLQAQGPGALIRPDVSKEIGLTEDQRAEIHEILERNRPPMPPRPGGFGEGPPPQPPTPPRPDPERRKRVEAEILAVLTSAQREKWAQMKGRPFDLGPRR